MHELDTREAVGGAGAGDAVPVAAMCGWRRAGDRGGFVVVTGATDSCELRFCRLPSNVRCPMNTRGACISFETICILLWQVSVAA